MTIVRIVLHIAILTCFYMMGVWIQQGLNLSIPGSIIGMLLLFLVLSLKLVPASYIAEGSSFILRHMPLLFLPVTIGILQFLDIFKGRGILLIFITIISTIMVMAVSSLVGQYLANRKGVSKE
ncbi:holin-like protein 2 [Halalkalibacter wakoensis JCM 9140]|uniref:Holin-like protein 2 n=1 Tax=Halalkalibacter wakoensis JCM 9140 TaxID=1236970 RepID=W4Q1F0_9BACI|nr:CidA/LrgA family holin-like protein [Halalkalibacter wakoensis]GAE25785.1 holin-like protein 2 [Halalkalibacter wakoensis JCM 9140]